MPSMNGFGNPYGTAEQMGNAPWHNAAEDYEPKADISYTSGKHAMKFGFSYNRYTKNQQVNGPTQGNFAWGGRSDSQFTGSGAYCSGKTETDTAQTHCYQGDGVIDMLLGMASNYDQQASAPINHYVNQTPSAYIMDNWHGDNRASACVASASGAGDALPHAWERNNAGGLTSIPPPRAAPRHRTGCKPPWIQTGLASRPTPSAGVSQSVLHQRFTSCSASAVSLPGLVNNDYKTLQPRVGFSEDLFGNGRTVLRGGFGTFYERMQGNDIYNAATNAPFVNDPGVRQSACRTR